MWVFGYGSLMWDEWEKEFNGIRHDQARLDNYRRSFNKKSTRNWGTRENPGPTLGLENGSHCMGCAFEFSNDQQAVILDYLRNREGASFCFKELPVELEDGRSIQTFTPINDQSSTTYIGNIDLEARVEMAKNAIGSDGECIDYVTNIHNKLNELGIRDPYVSEFYNAIHTV